jgi:tetratricopeptide (TPR) repeat protein
MNATRRANQVAAAVLIVSLAGAVATLRAMDHLRRRANAEEVLYIRSPKMLKRLCLGYTGLVADIYWTRAVQYFGYQHHIGSSDFHLLAPLLEMATGLDPKLVPAYQFGANYLAPPPPKGAGEPEKALELAKYGVEQNPDQWRLYYNLGFIYYMEFKDYGNAADAFARGAKLPIHNEFMPILAAQMAQHAGEFETSRMLWITTYQTSKDAQIQRNALDHLRALRVDEDVTVLEQAVAKYRESSGHRPTSLADLEIAGVIRGVPADPTGLPYMLTPDGRVEVQNPDNMPFITKGTPPGYEPPKLKADSK